MPKKAAIVKSCPKCVQNVAVASKACKCGHLFFNAKRSVRSCGPATTTAEDDRRRTSRVRREKPNYYDSQEYEKKKKKKDRRVSGTKMNTKNEHRSGCHKFYMHAGTTETAVMPASGTAKNGKS